MRRLSFLFPLVSLALICSCTQKEYVTQTIDPITPLPQPEIPDDPVEYNETAILSHIKSDFSWWETLDTLECIPDKFARGSGKVRIDSDADYIYGYVQVITNARKQHTDMTSILNNLSVWIDRDDVHEGQGGGWFMYKYKGMDLLLRGKCADNYIPQQWNPEVNDVSEVGDSFGVQIDSTAEWNNVGTGVGELVDTLFRYTFTIDRTRLNLKGLESIGLGISFDAGGYNDYAIIPSRYGFSSVKLNN